MYKYQLQDSSNDITLAAFRSLEDFQVGNSYHINNVEVNTKGPVKSLKYVVISSHHPCKKVVKVTATPSNQRTIRFVRVHRSTSETSSPSCVDCGILVDSDEDGFYDCVCGTSAIITKEVEVTRYSCDVEDIKDKSKLTDLMLTQSIFETIPGGKRSLITELHSNNR